MNIIELRNIGKVYRDGTETVALKNITFSIPEGEFLAIMGPSGSGKSTLLHILGLLDRPTSGEYFFAGKDTAGLSDAELARLRNKKIGFIFQTYNLLRRTSVIDNVKLPLMYAGINEKEQNRMARKALEDSGLYERVFDHEPSQLSGGEQQRAAIARAIVTHPEVIFADEPTGNLDSKSGEIVMATLQKLNDEGHHTIILVTHETYTAEYASRIIRIRDGQIESDAKVTNRRSSENGGFIK